MDIEMPAGFDYVKELGSGKFGIAKLCKDRVTGEEVAVKFLPRGPKIDKNVERELVNHRSLNHPNIIQFKKVALTRTHLAVFLEYASGGELFDRVAKKGRLNEGEARYFFQQLVCGVDYCHSEMVCHRDLKLENTLLDQDARVKICDFGYSKSAVYHSVPDTAVGTPTYIAPEVLLDDQYGGNSADVWSLGVALFIMLAGRYPFQDPKAPNDIQKTVQRIANVEYTFPSNLDITAECREIIERIFVADPGERISIPELRKTPWFQEKLSVAVSAGNSPVQQVPQQDLQELQAALKEACISAAPAGSGSLHPDTVPEDDDDCL